MKKFFLDRTFLKGVYLNFFIILSLFLSLNGQAYAVTTQEEFEALSNELKTYDGFTQLRKKDFDTDLDKYFEQHKLGKRSDFKLEDTSCKDQRQTLFKKLRLLRGHAQSLAQFPSQKENIDLTQQSTHNAKSILEDYLRSTSIGTYFPSTIKDALTTIGLKLNEEPQRLATWITSKDAEQVFHTLGIWNNYFDWYKPITETYYRVTQYTEFMETVQLEENQINPFAYSQLGRLGHLIDDLIPPEWDQSQKKWETVVKESDSLKRKEGTRELFYRIIPWKLVKYCGSLPQKYLSASPYNFLTSSLHDFKRLAASVSCLKEKELSFWEGAPSFLEKQYKEYMQKTQKFGRIEYLGSFFQGYINLSRIKEFADIEEQSKEANHNMEPFIEALNEQEQKARVFKFSFVGDKKLQEELDKRRAEGEFLPEKKGALLEKVQTFKRLRVLQGIGECIKELSPDFIRLLGLSTENVKTLRKIRDNLFHPGESMFKRLESILLGSQDILIKSEKEIAHIFKEILQRRFDKHFDDFRRIYFANYGNSKSLSSFLDTLPQEKFSTTSLENLEKSLKPQKKSKKQNGSKNSAIEFVEAKEDILKSWDYLGTITSRFRTQEIPDITMMLFNTTYRQFSNKYAPLFEEENIFSCAVEFLLSSFRESCKAVLFNFDKLIDYAQPQDVILEYKRQLDTLNNHFVAAKEIAHNGSLSLNWDGVIKIGRSRYEFISQDLLGGYRYKILGIPRHEDEFTLVGETQEPSFLAFLKSVKISGQKATFSKLPTTISYSEQDYERLNLKRKLPSSPSHEVTENTSKKLKTEEDK